MANHLSGQTSPYLLQHSNNPVDWYPWGKEAFTKAKAEDKPVFLSIGYSTCHWCHVMAHESFEDKEIADILNRYFVSIKVDREERPDLDSIYMAVCQAFTGSGGWPTSIFMTADQKPFFAGTYFPKASRRGLYGMIDLLLTVHDKWQNESGALLRSADDITAALGRTMTESVEADEQLLDYAVSLYKQSYDEKYGGFGDAPKFPTPHNLIFLMQQYEKHGTAGLMSMVENTLNRMYSGGLFDHIGYGFCRYSTDQYFLVPHFEKMLYDNALLIMAYSKAYEITKNNLYKDVAEKTASFILSEMTSPEGGFYSAKDADSDGVEGKYYVFDPEEIIALLGKEDGARFNNYYGIIEGGNFEGKSIPNRLKAGSHTGECDSLLPKVREYRHSRCHLGTDDKILTAWNSHMITALCSIYRITSDSAYLNAAQKAQAFIEQNLSSDNTLYVSYREGKHSQKGFLDDYADYIYALLALYEATYDSDYLNRANNLTDKAISDFWDHDGNGFYLYGKDNETLIYRPKESYDGAIPSGNSVMANCLTKLNALIPNPIREDILNKQLAFLSGEAKSYPAGHSVFLYALSDSFDPPDTITVVAKNKEDVAKLPFTVPLCSWVKVLWEATDAYELINDKTTYYVCKGHNCLRPVNELDTNM